MDLNNLKDAQKILRKYIKDAREEFSGDLNCSTEDYISANNGLVEINSIVKIEENKELILGLLKDIKEYNPQGISEKELIHICAYRLETFFNLKLTESDKRILKYIIFNSSLS